MSKLSLKDLDLNNKKVLMRVNFNVPMNKENKISDDTRICAALPSIEYVLAHGGSLILMSHMGRPKGKKEDKYSLKPCAERLSKLLNKPVIFAPDVISKDVEKLIRDLPKKSVLLLENLRFYEAEENPEKDPSFAKTLASYGDVYVNDAFGTAHRAHSSTATITRYFPNKAAAGFLMQKEIDFLGMVVQNPKKPFYAILGGAKVSSKIGVVKNLMQRVDGLFIGGGMAYTFLAYQGIAIGNSLFEKEEIPKVKEIVEEAKERRVEIHLPKDLVIADKFSNDANKQIISISEGVPDGWEGMDIGEKTVKEWEKLLKPAKSIFWNGPLGVFEMPSFAKGTEAIAKILAQLDALTIVGGGDSIAAINQSGLTKNFTHLSTGGGASLEYLEYGTLPGIEALSNK